MEPNISYCLVGAIFIGMMVMTMLSSKNTKNFKNFTNKLDDSQKNIYKSIVKERRDIYLQGLILGIVLALLITYNVPFSKGNNICVFIVISLGFNFMYYSLYPKSTYMLKHVTSKCQIHAWLNIYKEMQLRGKIGILLGIIGYILLGSGWCK